MIFCFEISLKRLELREHPINATNQIAQLVVFSDGNLDIRFAVEKALYLPVYAIDRTGDFVRIKYPNYGQHNEYKQIV